MNLSNEHKRAIVHAMTWQLVAAKIGRDPTVYDYAQAFAISPSTAFRYQSAFRAIFLGLDTPAELRQLEEAEL